MNEVWDLPPNDRLKIWRIFRKSIEGKDNDFVIQSIVDWWKTTPVSNRITDIYDSSTWPDPWELIHMGEFDENTICIGMAYTLHLIDKPCDVLLLQDRKKHYIGLTILVDETVVLNYNYGTINKYEEIENATILNRWNTEDLIK